MALLGIGIRRLSITPASVGPVKAMIRSLELAPLEADMPAMLRQATRSARPQLDEWASAHGIELG